MTKYEKKNPIKTEISTKINILTLVTPRGTLATLARGQNFLKGVTISISNKGLQYESIGAFLNFISGFAHNCILLSNRKLT